MLASPTQIRGGGCAGVRSLVIYAHVSGLAALMNVRTCSDEQRPPHFRGSTRVPKNFTRSKLPVSKTKERKHLALCANFHQMFPIAYLNQGWTGGELSFLTELEDMKMRNLSTESAWAAPVGWQGEQLSPCALSPAPSCPQSS